MSDPVGTDFARFLNLFADVGLGHDLKQKEHSWVITVKHDDDKVNGHYPFFVEFVFDQSGKFLDAGIWE